MLFIGRKRKNKGSNFDAFSRWRVDRGMRMAEGGMRRVFCSNVRFGIKILENQDFVLALFAHVVESLRWVAHQIQRRAAVMPPNVIGLHKVAAIHSPSVTHGKRPVFDGINQWSPYIDDPDTAFE